MKKFIIEEIMSDNFKDERKRIKSEFGLNDENVNPHLCDKLNLLLDNLLLKIETLSKENDKLYEWPFYPGDTVYYLQYDSIKSGIVKTVETTLSNDDNSYIENINVKIFVKGDCGAIRIFDVSEVFDGPKKLTENMIEKFLNKKDSI